MTTETLSINLKSQFLYLYCIYSHTNVCSSMKQSHKQPFVPHNASMNLIRIVLQLVRGGRWGGWLWGGDSVETAQQGHCQSRINMESELCPHAHSHSGDQGHRVKETMVQWWDNGMQCGCVPCAALKYVSPFLWTKWSSGGVPSYESMASLCQYG